MAVLRWDPSPYPDARNDRGAGLGGVGLEVFPPLTRIWSGHVASIGAATLHTVVSPAYHGPAILRGLSLMHGISNQIGEQTEVLILVSADGNGAGEVAYGGALPSGVSIVNDSFSGSGTQTQTNYRNALWVNTQFSPIQPVYFPLNQLIEQPDFFIKLCFTNPAGGSIIIDFVLTLFEQLDPTTVVELLAGL